MRAALLPHPTNPCSAIESIEAIAMREPAGVLAVHYCVQGMIDAIRWPAPDAAFRTDRLWEHTCFEVFVRTPDERAYIELNFSPSNRWAAYRFAGYRAGMSDLEMPKPPAISCRYEDRQMELHAKVDLGEFMARNDGLWLLAFSAVIEDQNGRKSYWALAHPGAQPDFHHADAFTMELR